MTGIKLSERYKKEREEICNKLIELVGTEFILSELDNNPELQQKNRDLHLWTFKTPIFSNIYI